MANSAPPEAIAALPHEVVETLGDPAALMDPGTLSRLRVIAEQEESMAAFAVVEGGLRSSLATAMHDVFLVGLGIALLAVVVTLFLREIPLRRTMLDEAQEGNEGETA